MTSFARHTLDRRILAALVLTLILAAGAAHAEIRWEFTMDGDMAGTPSSASGTVVMVLNDEMTEVTYDIRYTGLQAPEIASHFHDGSPGTNGTRLLTLPLGAVKQGVWVMEGRDLTILLSGNVYVNVHTDSYPSGEIRGNATMDVVPVEAATWAGVKALYR